MAKKLSYEIDVNAQGGVQGLKQFSRAAKQELKSVEDGLDDTASAGQKVAKVLSAMADQLDTELAEAARAADALATALGPELTSRADVGSLVADLNKLGLSFEEIEADADALAVSLKRMDDVQMGGVARGLGDVETSMGRVRSESDQSRSVLANMVGNSVQDIGALGGVAGTAGVALGQLGEYAAEGNISLGNLAKVAGPMAALGLAVHAFAQRAAEMAKTKAWHTDQVDAFTESIREGEDAAEALAERLTTLGKISLQLEEASFDDMTLDLMKAGLNVERFSELATGSKADLEAWAKSMLDAGADSQTIGLAMATLYEYWQAYDEGARTAAAASEFFGESAEDTARRMEDAARAGEQFAGRLEATARASEQATTAAEEHATALQGEADAMLAQIDAMTAAADSTIAAADAGQAFIDAAKASAAAQADDTKTLEEKTEAIDNERDALINAAKATQRKADDEAAASGTTRTATERVDDLNQSLIDQATFATPAARRAVYEYIIELNGIDPTKATEILALVDQGKLAEANAMLDDTSASRTAAIRADAKTDEANRELDRVAEKKRVAYINTYILPPGVAADAGTPAMPRGGGLAAEVGPELVRFPGQSRDVLLTGPTLVPTGTRVTSRRQTAHIVRHNGLRGVRRYDSGGVVAAAPTINVNFHNSILGDRYSIERTIARSMRAVERRSGRGR